MPNATITVDAVLKARLADLAGQTGQRVDEFVEALLRRIADADVRFERGVPVFPRRALALQRSRSKTLSDSPRAPPNKRRDRGMPEICRFFGIVISLNYNDHPPPHFMFDMLIRRRSWPSTH